MSDYRRLDYDLMPGLSDIYKEDNERNPFNYILKEQDNFEFKLEKAMNSAFHLDTWKNNEHGRNYRIPFMGYKLRPPSNHGYDGNEFRDLKPPPDPGCFKQMLKYAVAWIEYAIFSTPGSSAPVAPDGWCLFEGGFILLIVVAVIGLLAVYAGPFLESLGGLFGTLAQFLEFIWNNLFSLFSTVVEFVTFGFRYIVDGWKLILVSIEYIKEFVVDLTGANGYLVIANLLTVLVWCISQLSLELFEVELEWEQTDFYNIFEFLDTPIHMILDFIESLTDGEKNILYYVCKIFMIPFEIGVLVISLLIGGVWYLFKEMLDIIRNS